MDYAYTEKGSQNYTLWTTSSRTTILLTHISDKHLRNIFKLICSKRSIIEDKKDKESWKNSILDELDKRINYPEKSVSVKEAYMYMMTLHG